MRGIRKQATFGLLLSLIGQMMEVKSKNRLLDAWELLKTICDRNVFSVILPKLDFKDKNNKKNS